MLNFLIYTLHNIQLCKGDFKTNDKRYFRQKKRVGSGRK